MVTGLGPHGVDALLVGNTITAGALTFAGKVRAGFTPRLRRDVANALRELAREAVARSPICRRARRRTGAVV